MTINIIGEPNSSGIGQHTAGYINALMRIRGVNQLIRLINYQDIAGITAAAQESTDSDITISFVGSQLDGVFKGYNVNWTVFESTVIPQGLLNLYRNSRNLWIPSQWGRKILIENGIAPERISVVVEGVDPDQYHPYCRQLSPEVFRFLLIGKYEVRKSFDETIEAFAETYGNNANYELIIKSDFFKDPEIKRQQLINKINSLGVNNIHLIWGYQSQEEIANLYRSAQAFVFVSKAEGWGLPLIEAAASGLPLITTFYSAHTEFLQSIKSSCVFVPYELQPINCPDYHKFYYTPSGNYGSWAVPTKDAIKSAMVDTVARYPALARQAENNSAVIRQQYSWANSAIQSLEVLQRAGALR